MLYSWRRSVDRGVPPGSHLARALITLIQRYIMHARSNAVRGSNSCSSSRHYLLDPAYAVCSTSYTQHHRAIAPSRQHLAGKGHERREVRGSASQTATATSQRDVAAPPSAIDEQLAKDYNSTMKTQMDWWV
jgi:hypothetical protein